MQNFPNEIWWNIFIIVINAKMGSIYKSLILVNRNIKKIGYIFRADVISKLVRKKYKNRIQTSSPEPVPIFNIFNVNSPNYITIFKFVISAHTTCASAVHTHIITVRYNLLNYISAELTIDPDLFQAKVMATLDDNFIVISVIGTNELINWKGRVEFIFFILFYIFIFFFVFFCASTNLRKIEFIY
jgi:hypothetical protein